MVQAVLFDLDGTLIDSHDDIAAAFSASAREFGMDPPAIEDLRPLIGLPLALMVRALYGELDDARLQALLAAYRRHNGEHVGERTHVYPGTAEALAALAPRSLGVATTKRTPLAEQALQDVGLQGHFSVVQGTDDFAAKPAPDVLLRALARLGVAPAAALYVGDGPWDMQAARAAGMQAVGVNHEGRGGHDLRGAGAIAVLTHLSALPALIEGLS